MRTLLLCGLLIGCSSSGDNEYAALYEAPQGAATASMFGTWGGAIDGFDTRWVLTSNQVTLANKCGSTIVGVDVAADVSETQIRILESAQSGDDSCFVRSTPGTFTTCSPDEFEPKNSCFEREGKALTIYANDLDFLQLTKLTDATP